MGNYVEGSLSWSKEFEGTIKNYANIGHDSR
jgi:hypothetical protein